MKAAMPYPSLLEVERPHDFRGTEEIQKFIHLNDNMVRRVVSVQTQQQKNRQLLWGRSY